VGSTGTVSDAEGTGEEAVSGAFEHGGKSGGGRTIPLVKKDAIGRLKVDLKTNWNHWRNMR
jgi:hypothetical protein